jgi:hypothetical protein
MQLNEIQQVIQKKQNSAGILEQSTIARNRVGIWLSNRPARVQRLAESVPLESIYGFLKSIK